MPNRRHLPGVTTQRRVRHRSPNTLPSIRGLAPRLQTPNARCSLPVPVLWYSPHYLSTASHAHCISRAQLHTTSAKINKAEHIWATRCARAQISSGAAISVPGCCDLVVLATYRSQQKLSELPSSDRSSASRSSFLSRWATHSPNRWARPFRLWGILAQLFHPS